jgi:hypothetical protein
MPPNAQERGADHSQVAKPDLLGSEILTSGRAAHRHAASDSWTVASVPSKGNAISSSTGNTDDVLSDRFASLVHFVA